MIGTGAHVIFFLKEIYHRSLGEINASCPLLKVHFDYEAICIMTYLFLKKKTNLFPPTVLDGITSSWFLNLFFVSFVTHELIYSP